MQKSSSQLGFPTPGMRRPLRARRKRDGKVKRRLGRPPGSGAARAHHARPTLCRRDAVHVTMRVDPRLRSLRSARIFACFRYALRVMAADEEFRVVHLSLEDDHVHMLCEAEDQDALARGMNVLTSCVARRINRELGSRGKVFPHRYHVRVIRNPRQARNALAYVLNNWRRHREDWVSGAQVDRFSSGVLFDGWAGVPGGRFAVPPSYQPLPVAPPRTWLLREGWRKHHPLISPTEVPKLDAKM